MASKACEVPVMKEEKINGRLKWDVENDLRALRDASKIKNDKNRLASVRTLIKEEVGALAKIVLDNKSEFEVD